MLNKVILGTVQLGVNYGINNSEGKPSLGKSFDILNTAYENGIRTLDTAEAYGNAQEVIGAFHKKNIDKKFNVITKFASSNSINKEDFLDNLEKNCSLLNVEQLYGFMFHNYESFIKTPELYNELLQAKKIGLVKYTGISLYLNEEIKHILDDFNQFDFIQIPFNLFDNESKRKQIIMKAKEKGIAIHTRSAFLQGLFFKSIENLSFKLSPLKTYLEELHKVLINYNLSMEELALQYVLQKKYINHVLIGVDNSNQLNNNIKTCSNNSIIPHELLNRINVIEKELLNPSNWN
jgi:aryl-alcohol dehydrogenase-like predicted oxidoreductase